MRSHVVIVALVASGSGCIFDWKYTGQDTESDASSTGTSAVTTDAPVTTSETTDVTSAPTDSGIATDTQDDTSSSGTETEMTTTPAAVCGNDVCEDGEDSMDCEEDCPVPNSCDGGACQPELGENFGNCPTDCPAVCGNDVVEDTEECDDGVGGVPTESAECNEDCTNVECGDNITNVAAGEGCDDGNLDNLDMCVACTLATCGDGFVLLGAEDCDDGNSNEKDECSNACTLPPFRVVFLTSAAYPGALGGLAGADAKCNELAKDEGLGESFKAWLSDMTGNPLARFDTGFMGNYKLVDGTTVANGWMDLVDGSLDHAIDMFETGEDMKAVVTWSNTSEVGSLVTAKHCVNWSSGNAADLGRSGFSMAVNAEWTTKSDSDCESVRRLYCFEDGV